MAECKRGCIPNCIACRDGFHPEKRYGSLEEIKRDLFPHLYELREEITDLRRELTALGVLPPEED